MITLSGGVARIFQMPAVQSLAADSVTPDKIGNSVALTTMGQNITLIIGPLLGGILFQVVGPEGAYALIDSLNVILSLCRKFGDIFEFKEYLASALTDRTSTHAIVNFWMITKSLAFRAMKTSVSIHATETVL